MKKIILTLALVMALTLSLAGCGGNSTSSATNNTINQSSTPDTNSNTSSPADTASSGNTANTWSADWPSDIPKMDGDITVTTDMMGNPSHGMIMITVSGKDEAAFVSYTELLVSNGFSKASIDDSANGAKSFVTSKGSYNLELLFYADSGKCELTLNVYG